MCSDNSTPMENNGRDEDEDDIYQRPLPFIETTKTGELHIVEDTASRLYKTPGEIHAVVSIVGLYRTGKSFLLNRLAGKPSGFRVSHTPKAETKGIWIWVRPCPGAQDKHLVLMDTEGLDDVIKDDKDHDNRILLMAMLLSQILIYNVLGHIDEEVIANLRYIAEVGESLLPRKEKGYQTDFMKFFPTLVMVLRDFSSNLISDGKEISSDEHFEQLLQSSLTDRSVKSRTRNSIKRSFQVRKCFTMPRPTEDSAVLRRDHFPNNLATQKYLDDVCKLRTYIFTEHQKAANYKTNFDGFIDIAEAYLQYGDIAEVGRMYKPITKIKNEALFYWCIQIYRDHMKQSVISPAETKDKFKHGHEGARGAALYFFHENFVQVRENRETDKLKDEIESIRKELWKDNVIAASKACKQVKSQMTTTLTDAFKKKGSPMHNFKEAREMVEKDKYSELGLGFLKAELWNEIETECLQLNQLAVHLEQQYIEAALDKMEMWLRTFETKLDSAAHKKGTLDKSELPKVKEDLCSEDTNLRNRYTVFSEDTKNCCPELRKKYNFDKIAHDYKRLTSRTADLQVALQKGSEGWCLVM